MSEWISVKERLPYLGDIVLVSMISTDKNERLGAGYKDVWMARFTDSQFICVENHDYLDDDLWSVTHWMPLPEPPK